MECGPCVNSGELFFERGRTTGRLASVHGGGAAMRVGGGSAMTAMLQRTGRYHAGLISHNPR